MQSSLCRIFVLSSLLLTLFACSLRAQFMQDSTVNSWRTIGLTQLPNLDTVASFSHFEAPRAALDFEHILSLYRWGASVSYATRHDAISAPMASSVSVLAEGRSRLQEESNTLTSEASALVNGDIPLEHDNSYGSFLSFFGTSYAVSSSNQRVQQSLGLITNLLDGYGIGGFRIGNDASPLFFRAGAGFARQSVQPQNSFGTIVRSDATVLPFAIADAATFSGTATLDERFFPQQVERYSYDKLHTSLISAITENGVNELTANFGLQRRNFYYMIDSTTPSIRQQRREITGLISDNLAYPIIPNALGANLTIEYEPRLISRTLDANVASSVLANGASLSSLLAPNDVSGSRLTGEAKLALFGTQFNRTLQSSTHHPFTAVGLLHYEERDENVTLRSADLPSVDRATVRRLAEALNLASYSSKLTQALLSFGYQVDARTNLSVEGSARILRFDTPDANNHDDRDELISTGRVVASHQFDLDLSGQLELRLSRNHLVYLASDRSAQNNVTKTIAMFTQAAYAHHGFAELLRGEVYANYTVLDYADRLPQLTDGSYLLRGIELWDSTLVPSWSLTPSIASNLLLTSELNIFERGSYNTRSFSERPSARTLEVSAELTFGLLNAGYVEDLFQLRLGARAFLLHQTGVNPTVLGRTTLSMLNDQQRVGPLASLTLLRTSTYGPQLFGEIWYSFVRTMGMEGSAPSYSKQVESHLSVEWRF
jgi:hypothetical protein